MRKQAITLGQIASFEALMAAWKKVRANRGAAGLDRVTIRRFEENLETNLRDLSAQLLEDRYLPLPPRRALIPKSDGRTRPLGILSVEDRIVQRATLDALDPLCEPMFLDCSFGYRPGKSIRDAAKSVLAHRSTGHMWVVDADIEDFFGSLNHERLLQLIADLVADPAVFHLFELWLGDGANSGTRFTSHAVSLMRHAHRFGRSLRERAQSAQLRLPALPEDETLRHAAEELAYHAAEAGLRQMLNGHRSKTLRKALGVCGAAVLAWSAFPALTERLHRRTGSQGILQGAPISPLLANLYLHAFDQAMTSAGHRLVRYADDFVVMCKSREEAEDTLSDAERELSDIGLRLNREKTGIANFEEGFEFLGYAFQGDRAQMGDDPATLIRVPALRSAMYGFGNTVRNVSPDWADKHVNRLMGLGRRLFNGRHRHQNVDNKGAYHADVVR